MISHSIFHVIAESRAALEQRCANLIPFVLNDAQPRGLRKIAYKLKRSRIPRKLTTPEEWLALIGNASEKISVGLYKSEQI